jgi:anti-sigma factor RsiW
MSNHLSEDQFTKCIAGQPSDAELQHIRGCPECSAELEHFDNTLSLFRSTLRNRIDDRVALQGSALTPFAIRPAETGMPRWRWAVVAAALVVSVTLPFFISKPASQESSQAVSIETDADALMNAVNLRLSRVVPAPMEPMWSLLPNDESIAQSGGVQ